MDIYSFINSRDVEEHCRSLKHEFSAIETAFIVYQSKKHTIREKHDAYREIIVSMPDTEVQKRFNCPYYSSLHSVLRECLHCEHEYSGFEFFDGLWIEVPTPFAVGDILTANPDSANIDSAYENAPFVLTDICYWDTGGKYYKHLHEQADCTDMTASGLFLDEGGRIYSECMHAYQDLEYYRGELNGYKRILTAVSNHTKGEISTDLLLNAYRYILDDEKLNTSKEFLGLFSDERLALAGLEMEK